MRPFLHLVSLILALPVTGLAAAFLILDRVIAGKTLPGIFSVLLDIALWLIPWGLLACLAMLLVLVVGGLTARFRWLASLCVAALATASSFVVLFVTREHDNFTLDQLPFLVPGIVSACISAWLAVREWPPRHGPAPHAA